MIELKNISYYAKDSDNEILKNINLKIEDNMLYAITGPNGGGKSTLAKIIAGITQPTDGQIFFDGKDITSMNITQRANLGIGYAFQQPAKFKGITVRKLLEIASGTAKDNSKHLLEVGLCPNDYMDRDVDGSLSGGEIKRIEIATMLCRNLSLTIYDEPEAGIDLWSFTKLIDTFSKVHKEQKGTTLIISHQEKILQMVDKIIIIVNGEIRHIEPPKDAMKYLFTKSVCDLDCSMKKGVFVND